MAKEVYQYCNTCDDNTVHILSFIEVHEAECVICVNCKQGYKLKQSFVAKTPELKPELKYYMLGTERIFL